LTSEIALYKFENPLGFKLPTWSSFGSMRVHSLTLFGTLGSMKCESRASLLACNLASPCLGHEAKARVATHKRKVGTIGILKEENTIVVT
jgi:hypothetical protein